MRSTDLILPLIPTCLLDHREMGASIKTWLSDGDFELDSGSSSSATPTIRNATRSFESTLAREVDRFLCAMCESFAELNPSTFAARSISWPLIKAYYASYFAAHALLRMTGRCVTQVDNALSQSVMRSLLSSGSAPAWQITTSQYFVRYDENQQLLTFEDKHAAKGGSHQFVWKKFGELLTELISSSKAMGSAYQQEMLLLERMSDNLTSQQKVADYSWLSGIRNSVNYGFSHSVWFPFDGTDSRQAKRLIKMLKCDSETVFASTSSITQTELEKFCETATFLVSFANSAANAIVRRSSGRPFLTKSYGKLQRLVEMPL